MPVILTLGWLSLALFQWFAIMDGLEYWLDIPGFLAVILSLFVTSIPLVGTIAGFIGAMNVWGWSFYGAAALFFGPFIVLVVLGFLIRE